MNIHKRYNAATQRTSEDLKSIAESLAARDLSHLSLPEIRELAEMVAQVVPAGNVPGIILNGLLRVAGRRQMAEIARRDVNLLFKGVEQVLDAAVYSTLFAGPAAVLWGYRNLLKIAGKSPEDFFPDGAWQFYVEFALREDTARHALETHGFDTTLTRHGIQLSSIDRATAWVMTAIHCLHQYDELIKNEWRERVYANLLADVTRGGLDAARYAGLYREWEKQRPYARGTDAAPDETYSLYRRRKFDALLEEALNRLPPELHRDWIVKVRQAKENDLLAYQRQMSILAHLEPEQYSETRQPISIGQTHVGLIWQGRYALIPACVAGSQLPANVNTVRGQVAQVLSASPDKTPPALTPLARLRRSAWPRLNKKLGVALRAELEMLRFAPILINCDPQPRELPLAELRQAERGVGGHAMTLFDTGETFVFDLSHIFFDGVWGAALAEILTNEALAWAVYLHRLPPVSPTPVRPRPLSIQFQPADLEAIQQAPQATVEASSETNKANIQAILTLRRLFERRNERIRLTANDLLVLYRAIHAVTYQPDPDLKAALEAEAASGSAARTALEAIQPAQLVNPAILIPIDASQRAPRERLYPMNYEVPLIDLDLLNLHEQTLRALDAYQTATGERSGLYRAFDRLQRLYLATLAGFGEAAAKAKAIAASGEDASIGVLKLVGVLPAPVQRLLEKIPQRSDMLNDLIRGREVFSNLGAVAKTSSLIRFITAKDDNEQKSLAWGVITDAAGVMHISLRDFRPHVGQLAAAGRKDLATWIARDYLESYARGLNEYIRGLWRITLSSRETQAQASGAAETEASTC
jgi:hypothetical protein